MKGNSYKYVIGSESRTKSHMFVQDGGTSLYWSVSRSSDFLSLINLVYDI